MLNPIDSFVTPVDVPPGIYPYSATDMNGCVTYDTITITEPDTLNFTYSTGNGSTTNGYDIDCFGNATQLNITAIGGSPPFNFSLDNSVPSPDPISFTFNPVFAGNHIVSIIDNSGCMFDTTIYLSEPPIIYDSLTIINNACDGSCDGLIISNVQGGVSPYLFIWNNLQNSTTDTSIIGIDSNLCAGNYTLTIIDQNNCVENLSNTIYEPNPLSITVDSIIDIVTYGVNDGAIYITASGGDSSYSYSWIGPNGFTSSDDNINLLCAGQYIVTVDDSISVLVDTFNIYEPQPINTNLNIDPILCYNGQTQAQINVWGGTQPYSYYWSNGDTNFFTTLNSGNYNYTIIDENGCSYVDTFFISNPDSITLQASVANPSCNGYNNGEVIINITSGGTQPFDFLMMGNSTTQSSNSFNGLSQGDYTYIVTDINGCQNTISATLTDPPSLSSVISSTDVSCYGYCDGSGNITGLGGTSPYTYLWDNGASNLCAGLHNVIITDSNGCINTNSVIINEPDPLLINVWTVNDTLQATSGFITYQWNYNNVNIVGANDSIYIASLYGDYYVTVSDTNGCFADSYFINYSLLSLENYNLNIRIYPNPTNGNITIESKENINSISVFNTYGNQLYSVDNNLYTTKKINIDLSKFAKGVYFVKININNRIINERIILQ